MSKQEIENKTFNDKLRSLILKLNTLNSTSKGQVLKIIGRQAINHQPNYSKFINAMSKSGTTTQQLLKCMILNQEIKQELSVLFYEYGLKGLTNPYAFNNAPKIYITESEINQMKDLYNEYDYKGLIHCLEDKIIAKVSSDTDDFKRLHK